MMLVGAIPGGQWVALLEKKLNDDALLAHHPDGGQRRLLGRDSQEVILRTQRALPCKMRSEFRDSAVRTRRGASSPGSPREFGAYEIQYLDRHTIAAEMLPPLKALCPRFPWSICIATISNGRVPFVLNPRR